MSVFGEFLEFREFGEVGGFNESSKPRLGGRFSNSRHSPNSPSSSLEGVMSDYLGEVTDDTFEEQVLKSDKPVLVDFWAEWCRPCKQLTPLIEAVAEKYDGKARFLKLNVDESSLTGQRYGIKGIPTLIVFKNGAEAERVVGTTSKENISRMIDRALG